MQTTVPTKGRARMEGERERARPSFRRADRSIRHVRRTRVMPRARPNRAHRSDRIGPGRQAAPACVCPQTVTTTVGFMPFSVTLKPLTRLPKARGPLIVSNAGDRTGKRIVRIAANSSIGRLAETVSPY